MHAGPGVLPGRRRDQQQADDVGEEAGQHEQQRAHQAEQAVGGSPTGWASLDQRGPEPPPTPAALAAQPPATLVTITRSRVHARPISLTIATKTAISAIASATNANATMPARRIGVALPSSGAPAGHGSTQRREASPGAPNGHPPQRLPYYGKTHFARAAFPFGEGDRHLDHAKALAEGTPGQVDLEAVPL